LVAKLLDIPVRHERLLTPADLKISQRLEHPGHVRGRAPSRSGAFGAADEGGRGAANPGQDGGRLVGAGKLEARPEFVGVDVQTPNQDLQPADPETAKRGTQGLLGIVAILENPEGADAGGRGVPGEVGDVLVELAKAMAAGIVPNETGPDHRAIGVNDPLPGCPDRAVIGLGIGNCPSYTIST
jgi:hypothetical protein